MIYVHVPRGNNRPLYLLGVFSTPYQTESTTPQNLIITVHGLDPPLGCQSTLLVTTPVVTSRDHFVREINEREMICVHFRSVQGLRLLEKRTAATQDGCSHLSGTRRNKKLLTRKEKAAATEKALSLLAQRARGDHLVLKNKRSKGGYQV